MSETEDFQKRIEGFLEGRDPQKYIVAIEPDYMKPLMHLVIHDPEQGKKIKSFKYKPFLWMKKLNSDEFYGGDSQLAGRKMREYAISIKSLNTSDDPRMKEGFNFIAHSEQSYQKLIKFFSDGGMDIFKDDRFLTISSVDQFLIQTGKRLFKGFEDISEVHKLVFDLETTSLSHLDGRIFNIGIKDNRGYEKILDIEGETEEEKDRGEIKMICEFFKIVNQIKPALICGYNSENFDWTFIFGRCEELGVNIKDIAITRNPQTKIKRRRQTLKLAAEMEWYDQTIMWGYNIMDTIHAVRRAMAINSSIKSAGLKSICQHSRIAKPNRVYIDGGMIAKVDADTENKYAFNEDNGEWHKISEHLPLKEGFKETTGKYIVSRYLLDDLWETEKVDDQYNQASFLMASIIPSSFSRTCTMGTAAIWKILMLAWSYENKIGIPVGQEKAPFTGGLSRLLKVGYSKNVVKFDFASLYPSIQITHDVFPSVDISNALKEMLTYLYNARNKYKYLAGEAKVAGNEADATLYGNKQLPIKILNNSMFGSVSAPNVFPWGDMNVGEMITCSGRQYLRQMVRFFAIKGFEPLVLDTDGCNFAIPADVEKYRYVGKGTHRFVEKDKEYTGVEACVSEYNEIYMKGVMGLDVDEVITATINLSRKNYANLEPSGKIKLTGNTIKSKTLPIYIEEFLDKGITMLLNGDGKSFITHYYDYIDRLFGQQIPLRKIATRKKVKHTKKQYEDRKLEKNAKGNPMPRLAHMELIGKHDLKVDNGDTIYYFNTGTAKSHADIKVQKNKQTGEEEIIWRCELIPNIELEKNPDKTGPYNVAKYINSFNSRIGPLMVVFQPKVRETLLVTDPEDKQFYTDSEMKLINGMPMSDGDQDNIIDLLTVTDRENDFWARINRNFKGVLGSVGVNDTLEEELDVEAAHSQFEKPKVFNKIGEDDDKDNVIHEYEEPVVEVKPDPQQSLFQTIEEEKVEVMEEVPKSEDTPTIQELEDNEAGVRDNNVDDVFQQALDGRFYPTTEVVTDKTNNDLHREISELRTEMSKIKVTNDKNTKLLTQIRDIFGEMLLELKI